MSPFENELSEPSVELAIQTETPEDTAAAAALLESLDLERLVSMTLRTVGLEQAVTLSLVISGDDAIQALNSQYRGQEKPTDVLSFPLLDEPLVEAAPELLWQPPEDDDEHEPGEDDDENDEDDGDTFTFITPAELGLNLGDIIISWPTANRQAEAARHGIADELLFLFCHGVLHLVGYDDQTEAGYAGMVRLQQQILAEFALKG